MLVWRKIVPLLHPDLLHSLQQNLRMSSVAVTVGKEDDQTNREERKAKGHFVRGVSGQRNWITIDGSSGFPVVAGRYHLYVANNCPWCHRCILTRSVLGLQDVISMDVCDYRRDENGWQFTPSKAGCTPDTINGKKYITEIYKIANVNNEKSVPILWDKEKNAVVNNESSEIIRMLATEFKNLASNKIDLYPKHLAKEIDDYNSWIYPDINNGSYKAGFSKSQEAYDDSSRVVFAALDRLENILADRRFLCGSQLTEADIRLFPTLFRFDYVYVLRFKLNLRMLQDYPNLWGYTRDVYQQLGVAEASNLDHCVQGYFGRSGNTIVPIGPENVDFNAPTDRSSMN